MVIIIDEDGREYTSFISQTLDRLKQYDVRSLVIVALTNGEDDSVTAYWNASLIDIIKSKDVIEYDAIDRFIEANLQRYQAILNEQLENDDQGSYKGSILSYKKSTKGMITCQRQMKTWNRPPKAKK